MSRTWTIVNISVFSIWLAVLCFLVYREHTGNPLQKFQAVKGGLDKATYWYDIYSGTKKSGFGAYTFEWLGDEVVIKYEQKRHVKKGDRERLLVESYRCVSSSSYAVKSFEYASSLDEEKVMKVTGEVEKDRIVFILESPQKRKTFRTSTGGADIYLSTTFIPAIIRTKPAPGSVYTVAMLNMAGLSVKEVRVVVEEIRPVKLGINVGSYYKLRIGDDVFWSDAGGITAKEEYAGGMTFYQQAETLAKDPKDRVLFDPFSLPFVKSNKLLKDVETLKRLKVKLKGFTLTPALYERSNVTMNNDTLTIQKEDAEEFKVKSYSLPGRDPALGRHLMSDEWVLSDNKTVKGNALNMASLEKKDAFQLVRYLNSDLYFSVHTMLLFTLSDSLDIFNSHLGDYLERTVMFASFARAAGIPTRLMGGFVYRDGYFYYHTWPEVLFDRWIPMDPTLAQFPADVTHIPLRDGTLRDITSITEQLKSVNIEILEAR